MMTAPRWPAWPRIVAEALRDLGPPARGAFGRPHPVAADAVVAVMRTAMEAPRHTGDAPSWLLPLQVDCWRRATGALERFGGALIAEDVGFGKTWVALALGHGQSHVAVVAPAVLQRQWLEAAHATQVSISFHSHEAVSRGRLPDGMHGMVIVDEAHRFRNGGTRRVACIAPWLVGKRVVLCTATPIVNSCRDVCELLDLIVPDDALMLEGIPSIGALAEWRIPPAALDRVVIRSRDTPVHVPRRAVAWMPTRGEEQRTAAGMARLDELRLSTHPGVASLVRMTLLDGLASSDAAFLAALRRYRALLASGRESGGASRQVLRQFAGPMFEQHAMWELLDVNVGGELALEDLPIVDAIITGHVPGDRSWLDSLRDITADRIPTICFARHHETSDCLRRYLGEGTAWVTGRAAGIGSIRMPRALVLEAFGPHRGSWTVLRNVPTVLVATDVAAEGLNLQAAARIVHVDIPWTAMRIDQREGRLARLGQRHPQIELVTREPTAVIEAAMGTTARVSRKGTTAHRWLDAVARAAPAGSTTTPGLPVCVLRTRGEDRALVLLHVERGPYRTAQLVEWTAGGWRDAAGHLDALAVSALAEPLDGVSLSVLDTLFHDAVSHVTRSVHPARCSGPAELIGRLYTLSVAASQRRDAASLERLDRLLRFVGRAGSRGSRAIVSDLAAMKPDALATVNVPRCEPLAAANVRVRAALVFRSRSGLLR